MTRSRFTPSLMPRDLLERLFVAREQTLARILGRVGAAMSSDERNHTLLVGPRGSGKTHLVSLVYYRARDLGAQLAWLPEDPWTIVSYARLLREIAQRLEPPFDEPPPSDPEELEGWLIHRAHSDGPIVVLVENIDQILRALGNEGQQRLRHLLQAHRPFLLIATTTRLDRSLSDQAKPFYGFFTTTRLDPFDASQAAAMLAAIAAENGDDRLVEYLASDEGARRLQTITHLAGGQPRMWAVLASALDVTRLDELVDVLLTRFDDLTPYYQEQLARLSNQQRLVVAELAEADRPINVADLAKRLETDQRSLSKTVSDLVERGWVAPTRSTFAENLDRRRTYYELAEPLARISFQIKEARGEPLRVVVEFLKHWFDPRDLDGPLDSPLHTYMTLAAAGQRSDPVLAVTRTLSRLPATRAPAVELLGEIDDALAALDAGSPEPTLRLPTPIRTTLEHELASDDIETLRSRIHRSAWSEFGDVRHPSVDAWVHRAERWVTTSGGIAAAQVILTGWLARAWRFEEAEHALKTTITLLGPDHPGTLRAQTELAYTLEAAGRAGEAVSLYESTLAAYRGIVGDDHPATLAASHNLAATYDAAGRHREALELQESTLPRLERVRGIDDLGALTARNNIAILYMNEGRTDEAIAMQEETVARYERFFGSTHPSALSARHNLGWIYEGADRHADAMRVFDALIAPCEGVMGTDHPLTLSSRGNRAWLAVLLGHSDEAYTTLEQTLAAVQRAFGDEHPTAATARHNLAFAYVHAGRTLDAIAQLELVVATRMRVLGENHPLTIAACQDLEELRTAGRPSPPTDPAPALDPR